MIADTSALIDALSAHPGEPVVVAVNGEHASISDVYVDHALGRVVIELDDFEAIISLTGSPLSDMMKEAHERRPNWPGA
jgi:hypothetical protein